MSVKQNCLFVITNQTIFWKAENHFIEHFDYSDSFLHILWYVAVHIFVPELTLKIMMWENPTLFFIAVQCHHATQEPQNCFTVYGTEQIDFYSYFVSQGT